MLGALLTCIYTDAFEKLSWFSALVLRVHRGDDDAHTCTILVQLDAFICNYNIIVYTNNSLCRILFYCYKFYTVSTYQRFNKMQNITSIEINIPFMTVLRKNNKIYYATFFNVIKFCLFFVLVFLLLQLSYFHLLFNEFFFFYLFAGIRMGYDEMNFTKLFLTIEEGKEAQKNSDFFINVNFRK